MSRYAQSTDVSADRSRSEIERTLSRYGANSFSYGWDDDGRELRAMVGFRLAERSIRFLVLMPSRDDEEFTQTETGRARKPAAAQKAFEQACRQRWRALALVVKAKLEAVESGISTFEEEFMAWVLLPNGRTVGEVLGPQINRHLAGGPVPRLALPPADDVVDAEVIS